MAVCEYVLRFWRSLSLSFEISFLSLIFMAHRLFSRFYESLLYSGRRALRNPYTDPSSHMREKTAQFHRLLRFLSLRALHGKAFERRILQYFHICPIWLRWVL